MSAAAEKTFNKLVGIETKVGRPSKASQEKKAIGRYSLDVLQNAIRRTNASQALKKQKAALQVQTAFRGFSAKRKVKQLKDTRIQRIERLRTPKPKKSANPAKITKKILNLDENIQLQKKIDYAKKKIAEKKEEIKISKDKIYL